MEQKNDKMLPCDEKAKNVRLLATFLFWLTALYVFLWFFSRYTLPALPFGTQVVIAFLGVWLPLVIPAVLMKRNGETLTWLGFTKVRLLRQIVIGVLLALGTAAIFYGIPACFGIRLANTTYHKLWEFLLNAAYQIFFIAVAEEILFRGYLYQKLLDLKLPVWGAALICSILFGLAHIISAGSWLQCLCTAIIGFFWCAVRITIKDCSLLSLMIAHGLYSVLLPMLVMLT